MKAVNHSLRSAPLIESNRQSDLLKPPAGMSRGFVRRRYRRHPLGTFATPWDRPVYPRDEWPDRIRQREQDNATGRDRKDFFGITSLDQNGTNYCWINAPVQALHYGMARSGREVVRLSPASAGALIKNFRNVGGLGSQGVAFMVEHGVCPASLWPENAIDRRYHNEETKAARRDFGIVEFYELEPRNHDQKVSALLDGFTVACGYSWWGHETLSIDPVLFDDGSVGSLEDNSWSERWGEGGLGVLSAKKSLADDAVAIRVVKAPHEVAA